MQIQGPSRLNDFLVSGVIAFALSPFVIIVISEIYNDYPPPSDFIGIWIIFAIIGTIIFFIISLFIRPIQGSDEHLYSDYPPFSSTYNQPQYSLQPTSSVSTQEKYKTLEKLDSMRDKGIISEEEFQKEKDKILNS